MGQDGDLTRPWNMEYEIVLAQTSQSGDGERIPNGSILKEEGEKEKKEKVEETLILIGGESVAAFRNFRLGRGDPAECYVHLFLDERRPRPIRI